MADLVDEHMGDDGAERLAMRRPVVENGPAIEKDHIGQAAGLPQGFGVRKPHALEKTQEIELALGLHLIQHLVSGKIFDADDELAAQRTEPLGKTREGLGSKRLDIAERR